VRKEGGIPPTAEHRALLCSVGGDVFLAGEASNALADADMGLAGRQCP
jgi:hypothetical protein